MNNGKESSFSLKPLDSCADKLFGPLWNLLIKQGKILANRTEKKHESQY